MLLPAGLSIQSLFTPAVSGVGPNPPPTGSWLATLLSLGATVGLSTGAWQSGGITRTELAIMASALMLGDVNTSLMAQGGFLDFAASGTVTYTDPQTGATIVRYVTPDPSNSNTWPTPGVQPGPGWLDLLADSTYNVQRILGTFASGNLTFANVSGSPTGAFPAGTYHVANNTNGATYSNTSSLTVAASTTIGGSITNVTSLGGLYEITTSSAHGLTTGNAVFIAGVVGTGGLNPNGFWPVNVIDTTHFALQSSVFVGAYTSGGTVWSTQAAPFQADLQGSGSNAAPGSIIFPVTSIVGVSVWNFGAFNGNNVESNTAMVTRCRAKLGALSPNGPKAAYAFIALSAFQLLSGQVEGGVQQPVTTSELTQAITQVAVAPNTSTGVVNVTIGGSGAGVPNGLPTVLGVAGAPITGASGTPIVLVVPTSGMISGMKGQVTGVQGNTAANGIWQLTVIDGTHLSLNGSASNGTYTTGGALEAGDLGLVDSLVQSNVVPNAVTATTVSALALVVTVAMTVWVPAAQASNVIPAISAALTSFFPTIPIGGFVTGVPTPNTVPIDVVKGVLFEGAPYIRDLQLTLNGVAQDVAVPLGPPPSQAVLAFAGGSVQTAVIVNVF